MHTSYVYNDYTIVIDLSRDALLSEAGTTIMKDRYLLKEYDSVEKKWKPKENSPQECFARSACSFASNQKHAQKLYDYASKNWMMFATPILTNAGTRKGLPISCFLNSVDDSIKGILDHHYESGFLASYGGGIGGDWSSLRPSGATTSRGNVSTGVIAFMCMMDTQMLALHQGSTRRGSYAAYMSISHPEIEEFINIRTTGGDTHRRCLGDGFHHGINISDSFMNAVTKGNMWDLIDPNTKEVVKQVDARDLWMSILLKRLEKGEPYLHFTDTSNKALPKHLKKLDLKINGSNLCSEIYLPTNEERTAVCCLSSTNLEYFDEWSKDPEFIPCIVEMLDNVLSFFIKNAPKTMSKSVFSAKQSRDIGLGAMGFYLYLQKKGIPFQSPMAVGLNRKIFKHIKDEAEKTNKHLAKTRGEAPDAKGLGKRFSHLMAIAPNANTATICGNTSPSIEPFNANAFKLVTMSGSFIIKNKLLEKLFREEYKIDEYKMESLWNSILSNSGSVQHLDFLSNLHKELFKTAFELDQMWIIEHAGIRQPYICQGQSVNLFIPPDIHKNDLHKLHYQAWKKGLKGLYYCRSNPIRKVDNITDHSLQQNKNLECLSCEG